MDAAYRHTGPRTPQTNGCVSSEVSGIDIYSHRALAQVLHGFDVAYDA